ncbi:MAG: metallophosphoesterase family protein [Candidatus Limnocylindrales bacterium]
MARKTRLYFATDVHGSSKCFRKFLNAGPVYGADVMILGGDVAGKAIQTIVRQPGGRWHSRFIGVEHDVAEGTELEALEKLIADHGYYPYRAEPGEVETLQAEGKLDALFLELMRERLTTWLALADERLRPLDKPLYFMLGNDDPVELAALLDAAPWGQNAEGRVLRFDDDHELISWGFSNITPWHSHREQTEPQLTASLERMATSLADPSRAIVNIHVPPYGSQLDDAPVLDADLRVQQVLGQVKFAPAGSPAVRDFLTAHQPLLGLHGHIHEASGIRRIGRTIAINPGSDYSTGTLNGTLVTLERDKVSAHQLVRG